MKKNKSIFFLIFTIFFSFNLIGCNSNKDATTSPLKETNYFMGTVVTISLYDKQDQKILDKAFERVKDIENTVSINKLGTELDNVNDNAGISPIAVSDTTFDIVKRGLYYSNLTNGFFDISIGGLVKLWSIGLPEAKLPTQSEIDEQLNYVNYKDIELNETTKTIFLKKNGMLIDLGSIAKGYAADEIAKILKSNGVNKAIIDLGGNILTIGEKAKDTPWKIGIQNPNENRGSIVGSISVSDKSIVTSGIYERYLETNDIKYHHLLSPFTGYPFDNDIAGVTIISDNSMDGDALSTSVFSMGTTDGLKFINSLDYAEAIFITKDNKVYLSEGINDIFTLTNTNFTIVENN
ncbi:MAG: FAD:protein FMN transferase [Clostridium sp.]